MQITRTKLFENERLQVGFFEARVASDACGDVDRQTSNLLVLPFSGVFSKYDAPGRYVIGTPSHAVFIAADRPYRLGFPGAIGDRALTFRFDEDLAPEQQGGWHCIAWAAVGQCHDGTHFAWPPASKSCSR